MSGRVPPSKRAGSRVVAGGSDTARAARRFTRFTGDDPEVIGEVNVKWPTSVAVIGEIEAIEYVTRREGKIEHYRHDFSLHASPMFCVSPDGKLLIAVGNNFTFTDRGIVDKRKR